MSKALVIKGVNFSTNKLTTIEFDEDIPCTGISLSESTYSITSYTPVEVEYSVTPENTTDSITWSSSDTSVVTVSNGIITAVGLGTATITATCGSYSDTATVTVAIAYISSIAGGARTKINTSVDPYIVSTNAVAGRFTAYGSGAQETLYRAEKISGWTYELKGIKLPFNTSKVKISRDSDKGTLFYDNSASIVWAKDEHCGNNTFPYAIKPVSEESFNLRTSASHILDVPSGADSCFVVARFSSTPDDYDNYITESGFQIEFLES